MSNYFVVSTPSGRRVLHHFGHGFASVNDAYEPDVKRNAPERLQLRKWVDDPVCEPDGVFINARHLWAISNGLAKKRKRPITMAEIGSALFYDEFRPDVTAQFAELAAQYSPVDLWWQRMMMHGRYDPAGGTIHPV